MTINVAALTAGRNTPSSRFRIRQHLTNLNKYGIAVTEYIPRFGKDQPPPLLPTSIRMRYVLPYFAMWEAAKTLCRIPDVLATHNYDATWITRTFLNGFPTMESLVHKPMVLDIDDAIWTSKPFGTYALTKVANAADIIIVGNEYLAEWFSSYNKPIHVLPTAVDTSVFIPKDYLKASSCDTFIIGWTGSGINLNYLYRIESALSKFMLCHPKSELHILSDIKPSFTKVPQKQVRFFPWNKNIEASLLRSWDVGIMPLSDDVFTRGKCSFKMLQYMASALPVIVSPVGMNNSVLRLGTIGFSASTDSEWIEALESLFLDPELRVKMGTEGRKIISTQFSTDIISRKIAEIFHGIA